MRFEGEDIAPGTEVESEFCAGADLGLRWRAGGRWRLGAELSYLHVFTATPLRLGFLRIGVQRRFDAPRGWQDFWQ
jgi:hypothetical protein